jgi:hypothetical protein
MLGQAPGPRCDYARTVGEPSSDAAVGAAHEPGFRGFSHSRARYLNRRIRFALESNAAVSPPYRTARSRFPHESSILAVNVDRKARQFLIVLKRLETTEKKLTECAGVGCARRPHSGTRELGGEVITAREWVIGERSVGLPDMSYVERPV